MLPFRVFASLHPRLDPPIAPHRATPISLAAPRSAKSLPLNPFADPHPLTPIASIFYKNIGGRVEISTCFELSPYILYSCALFCAFLHHRKTQPLSFQTVPHSLPKTTRGGGTSNVPRPNAQTLKRSNVQTFKRSNTFPPSHCSAKPLVQQFAKARDFFAIRGNNSAPPGV
jgi:hypothetical protein